MTAPYTCGGCTNTWTGLAQCHCSVCHETFGGISNFDRHRFNGECRRPEDIGLAIGARGVWSEPFSWAREGDHSQDVLTAFAHQQRRELDDERPRFTYDDIAALSELGSDTQPLTRRVPEDELRHWREYGHIDTDGPEQQP